MYEFCGFSADLLETIKAGFSRIKKQAPLLRVKY